MHQRWLLKEFVECIHNHIDENKLSKYLFLLFINSVINSLPIIFQQYTKQRAMNIFSTLPSLQAFFQSTKLAVKSFTHFGSLLNSPPQLKSQKEKENDTTMTTEAKIDEDSHIYSHSEENSFENNIFVQQKQYLCKNPKLISLTPEKRHENISYFHFDGKKLNPVQGRQIYEQQQNQLRKRRRSFSAETTEHYSQRQMKKYISNNWIPKEREQNYMEMHSEIGKNTIKNIQKIEGMTQTVTKVTFRVKSSKKQPARKISFLHHTDLPDIGKYSINYSMENLSQMTYEEISSLRKLTITNQWGKIHFLQPVSLFRKDIDNCLTFCEESIEIHDEEWKNKRIQLVLFKEALLNERILRKIMKSACALGLTTTRYSDRSESLIFTSGNN